MTRRFLTRSATSVALSVCLVALFSGADAPAVHPDRLVLLDGSQLGGTITGISEAGLVAGEGWDDPVPLSGLRRIDRPAAANAITKPALVVDLAGGGRILADAVTLADEVVRIRWKLGDEISVPIDAVRAVRLRPEEGNADFERALSGPAAEMDRLFLEIDEKLTSVEGFIESLDAENVVFEWNDQRRTMPRDKFYGAVTAVLGELPKQDGRCLVELQDGSRVSGHVLSLAPAKQLEDSDTPLPLVERVLKLRVVPGADVSLPFGVVTRITVESDRLVYLSDLEPSAVEESTIVAFPRSWRKDRSIDGRTLKLGGRTFSKGIGVQSRSSLTFDVDDNYELFSAVIGIDAETSGRGDCEFVVTGEGRELFRKRMRGGDEPHDLRLDIRRLRRVTLLVEPGADLDLADHADWADAVFIKPAE